MDVGAGGIILWEKTHVSKWVITKPSHIQPLSIIGIELGSQLWETSLLTTTLPEHQYHSSKPQRKKNDTVLSNLSSELQYLLKFICEHVYT